MLDRLSEGHFAKEAMDELVGLLTQDKFKSKLVVILAGYDQEMNDLLSVNPGLSSRFPDEVVFRNLSAPHSMEVLSKQLAKRGILAPDLENKTTPDYSSMLQLLEELARLPSWGNARDLITLSKQMITLVFSTANNIPNDKLSLSGAEAIACTQSMLDSLRERSSNVPKSKAFNPFDAMQQIPNDPPLPPSIRTTQEIKTASVEPKKITTSDRDSGVSDAVWHLLQADKKAAEQAAKIWQEELEKMEQKRQAAVQREEEARVLSEQLARRKAKDAAEQDDLMRRREEVRLKEVEARAERDRIAQALERMRQEEVRRRQQEMKAQAKLREMGVCVAGFRWIKQAGGYRCAGGSHFVTDAALGI